MRKQLCGWLVCSAAVFAPALAHAEDEPKAYPECTKGPTDAETAAAKGAYQAGNASFDEADYPRAITYWEDAYRRDCTANLLLKKQIAAEKAAPPTTGATPPPPPTTPPPPATEPEPVVHTGKRSLVPLVVTGAGVAIAVVGVVIFVPAAKDVSDFGKQCPNHMCPGTGAAQTDLIDKGNKARSKELVGGVLMGVGGAAIVGGIIWYFAQPRGAETSASLLKPQLTPALTPGFAGLSLSGAF